MTSQDISLLLVVTEPEWLKLDTVIARSTTDQDINANLGWLPELHKTLLYIALLFWDQNTDK